MTLRLVAYRRNVRLGLLVLAVYAPVIAGPDYLGSLVCAAEAVSVFLA